MKPRSSSCRGSEEKVRDATRRAEIETARAKITLPLALSKQQLELEKLKVQRARSEERLEQAAGRPRGR